MEFLASLHPLIVHFPVALLILYPLFEAGAVLFKKDFLSTSANIILVIAIIASLAAVLTGDQAMKIAEATHSAVMNSKSSAALLSAVNRHQDFATITLWYYSAILVIRTTLKAKNKFTGVYKYLILFFAITGIFLVYKTGKLGGELVYKYGAGTELIKPADSLSTFPRN